MAPYAGGNIIIFVILADALLLGHKVVYIDTESSVQLRRLREILITRGGSTRGIPVSEEMCSNAIDAFNYMEASSSLDTLKRLLELQPQLVADKVRLLVLDSAAAWPRREFDDVMKRQERLIQIITQMK